MYAMTIPIRNIYYLFCYAWGCFPEGSQIDVSGEEAPDFQNLLAKTLVRGTNHLLRRGLDRQYVEVGEDTKYPHGRIEFSETVKRSLRRTGRVHCIVDELAPDLLHNQIIKTVIGRLKRVSTLEPELRRELGILHLQLEGISEIRISKSDFRRVQLYSNYAFYRFLLHLCELIFDSLLPLKGGTEYSFYNVMDDEDRMWRIFEKFVRNFYRYEQSDYRLGPRRIEWDVDTVSEQAKAILPAMENDIRLDRSGETILIDTKYYKDTLVSHHKRHILRPGHLYQIFTYVKNLARCFRPDHILRGMLLYPAAGQIIDATMSVQGHPIRVFTLNLDQDWQGIHNDMLDLLSVNSSSV